MVFAYMKYAITINTIMVVNQIQTAADIVQFAQRSLFRTNASIHRHFI